MIVNKKIIASVLAVASVLTVSAGALADDNITVTVNGNNVSFVEITPFIENDHTLVPMREYCLYYITDCKSIQYFI